MITATLTDNISPLFAHQTYVNIYHIVNNVPQFNMLVDRRQLALDSLSIADIDILTLPDRKLIVLTDTSSRLVMFQYFTDNSIGNIQHFSVQGTPRQLFIDQDGTYFIANDKNIVQYSD